MKTALVTGCSGLIGSQCVSRFCELGYDVIGIDNDMRNYFFGTSIKNTSQKLISNHRNFKLYNTDIRSQKELEVIFDSSDIDIIIHTAAQPSHDWAAREPLTDFSINATATMILLELYRKYCPSASFVFTSTNKVYGDRPNLLNTIELESRYDTLDGSDIDESMSIDNSKHSIFGASKVAADIMVQEYGKYFDLNTVCFRCGCLTGENHQGAKLHGFLSYLVKCIMTNSEYSIYGYKGKQVRDNIHSDDLVSAFIEYHKYPTKGDVYNMGGGRENSLSILEAIDKINHISNRNWKNYSVLSEPRVGDHKWYISDLSKFKTLYPNWKISTTIEDTLKKMVSIYDRNI